jgi:cytochrome c-type biogenesis protein
MTTGPGSGAALAFLSGVGPSAGYAYYLGLGMFATVNPCGFAMLPAYLSYFLGLDNDESDGAPPKATPLQALRVALAVSAGFMSVFAVAGAAVRHTSLPIYQYSPWISVVIGLALVALGIAMLRGFELVVKLPQLNRGGRERTVGSMFVFGMSYAIASLGCTLPLFLLAVVGTMNRDSFTDGIIAFVTYGVGMAVVLSAVTVGLALARTSIVAMLRSTRQHVNRVAGGLVLLAGAYVTFYGTLELRTYNAGSPGAIPSSGITDRAYDWSSNAHDWIARMGAVRLGAVLVVLTATALSVSMYLSSRRTTSPDTDEDKNGDGTAAGPEPAPMDSAPASPRA